MRVNVSLQEKVHKIPEAVTFKGVCLLALRRVDDVNQLLQVLVVPKVAARSVVPIVRTLAVVASVSTRSEHTHVTLLYGQDDCLRFWETL